MGDKLSVTRNSKSILAIKTWLPPKDRQAQRKNIARGREVGD